MDENKILGEQPIPKLLLKFSVPCVTGLLIGALYNIVDQIFIGNSSLGYLGNAATGISFPVICIANAFAWCVGDGAASYLSICSGRQDTESAHKCVGTGLSTTLLISLVLSAVCLLFCRPLMVLFGASDATLTMACDYFTIIALFFPAYLMFNVMNGIIRADGSPTYAMIAICSGAVLNIILDPICIFVFDWGIKGAAIATVVGQAASFAVSAVYFLKPKSFRLSKSSFRINTAMLRNLIVLGGSTFIIQISMVVMTLLSNITLAKYGALSVYGSDIPLSVFSIQTKVYTIVSNIAVGIALGGQPILGYNYGAKKMDRVKQTYFIILLSSLSVGIAATLVFECCPQVVIGIFGKQNELYMDFAIKSFRIFLGLSFVTCFIKISSIFFQSIGRAVQSMVASVIRDLFCFTFFTLVLCRTLELREAGSGIYGILFAAPLSDLVAGSVITVLTVLFFRRLKASADDAQTPVSICETHPGTIVTIARQHGTRGKQIGEMVAKRLNIPFYDKELTALVAQESGLAKEFIQEDYDDPSDVLHRLYLSTHVGRQGIIAQEKVIRKIADAGACVIVGRAADHVLRHYPNVVRIFIHATSELRIENIRTMYGDSYEQARQHMLHSDESRASYYRNTSGGEWQSMENYDLCLDASIGKEATVQMIVSYIEKRDAAKQTAEKK